MDFFSTKITNDFQKTLKLKLADDGYDMSVVQNALWKAAKNGINVTCYASLKLLVQGKNCNGFVAEYIDAPTVQAKLNLPQEEFSHNFSCWIGTDESGKGDYIGPLVAAGVMIKKEQAEFMTSLNIKDSKKLTDKFIIEISPKIKQNCAFSVVTINPEKYNQLYAKFGNLNKLLAWAHARVIENILEKEPACENAISDKFGDESLIKNALQKKGKKINLIQRTKAESDIAVACASVLAREEFVKRTKTLSQIYGIDFAKGGGDVPTQQAADFVQKFGKDKLNLIAKMHFKNTQKII
ncbi:MAG: ribonuclease HIII [bacterium]|nr:ribonuclease HIII [bacterium]